MRKDGFTLVELLGVMVILTLLMLFAFPKIINQVKSSTNSTDEFTEKLIYNAVDLYLDDNKNMFVKDSEINYCIPLNTLVDNGYLKGPIKLNGSDTDITNLKTVEVSYSGQYDFKLKDNSDCSGSKFFSNGQVVYFDVKNGEKCTNYTSENSKDGYNGIDNATSNQNSCLKFYAFLDNGGYNVNLILDHNIGTETPNKKNSNQMGPTIALDTLSRLTSSWKGTSSLRNYTYNSSAGSSSIVSYDAIEYELNYSSMKARFITANEVAKLGNVKNFSETTYDGYLKNVPLNVKGISTSETTNELGWLFDNLSKSTKKSDYYTSSAVHDSYASYWIVSVYYGGSLTYGPSKISAATLGDCYYGIRPVIEVKRNKIS